MTLVELIKTVHETLDRHDLPHAFGGALALAYYAEPRGTDDVDVNVFVDHGRAAQVTQLFEPIGYRPDRSPEEWQPPSGGVRLLSDTSPFALDLFFSLDPRYDTVANRVGTVELAGARLPILSPEDLAVFKMSFNRDQDWVDIGRLAAARPGLDLGYIEDQLIGLRGPHMYPRIARLRAVVERVRTSDPPAIDPTGE
ncbi:MAG TPA: hypothetical protein VFA11_07065 [Acidimicrobiales bacterium]|nr:hypothetical protein [Acidimicrobiales bacterium]